MLEMIRLKLIRVFQQGGAGAIRIYKRARPADAPHPIHDPEDEYKAHHPPAAEPKRVHAKSGPKTTKSRHERPDADADAPDEARRPKRRTPKMELSQLKAVIESLIFASPEPITPRMLNRLLNDEPKEDVQAALEGAAGRLRRSRRAAHRRSRGRVSDHDAARIPRMGAAAVPRAVGGRSCRWRRSKRCR